MYQHHKGTTSKSIQSAIHLYSLGGTHAYNSLQHCRNFPPLTTKNTYWIWECLVVPRNCSRRSFLHQSRTVTVREIRRHIQQFPFPASPAQPCSSWSPQTCWPS
jgi:hypothetical protein